MLPCLALAGCGGLSIADVGGTGSRPDDGGVSSADVMEPEELHFHAVALPNSGIYGGVFMAVTDEPELTCDDAGAARHCSHWHIVVEMAWELVKVGTLNFEQRGITASSIVAGPPTADGTCDSLQVSGTRGELAIDAIDDTLIRGRFLDLRNSGEPELALPREPVAFAALRCPGEWPPK